MKVVGLISGGKDSCYNLLQCVAVGHEIVALAHMKPVGADELDSFMYQSVGQEAVGLYAEAMDLPLYQGAITGTAVCSGADYLPTDGDEVEALHRLLQEVKDKEGVEGVSVGAIMSNYQRVRVENVCARLELTALAYMWRRDQEELMAEMIAANVRAIVIKVAAMGLSPTIHLGKDIADIFSNLLEMKDKFGLNVCGEGGEYETFTLDCPLFKKAIVVEEHETVIQEDNEVAPVAFIKFKKLSLRPKPNACGLTQLEMIEASRIRGPLNFLLNLDLPLTSICQPPPQQHSSSEQPAAAIVPEATVATPTVIRLRGGWRWFCGIAAPAGDVAEVTAGAMDRLLVLLAEAKFTAKQVVAVQLFVGDMTNFNAINAVYKKYFDLNPPCRVCVQVPLPPNVAFVLDCLAYKEEDGCSNGSPKHMHVQGVSHWAPANIGPYSQAVQVGDLIHVAGQIPLLPATMQLVGGGIVAQCRLALRHVRRVLCAVHPGTTVRDVIYGICFVTRAAYADVACEEWDMACRSEGGECSSPAVHTVVVPGLPRGSDVEWQVVAHAGSPSEHWTRFELDDAVVGNICVRGNGARSDRQGTTFLMTECGQRERFCGCAGGSVNDDDLVDLFRHYTRVVDRHSDRTTLEVRTLPSPPPVHFQMYFSIAYVTASRIRKAWHQGTDSLSSALSLVPVTGHPRRPFSFATCVLRM